MDRFLLSVAVMGLLGACAPADFDGLEARAQPVGRSLSPEREAEPGEEGAPERGGEAGAMEDEGMPTPDADRDTVPGRADAGSAMGDGVDVSPSMPAGADSEHSETGPLDAGDSGLGSGKDCEAGDEACGAAPECEDGSPTCGGCAEPCPAPQFGVGRCTPQGCEQVTVTTDSPTRAELTGQLDGGAVIDPPLQCADGEVMVGIHGRFAGILYGIGIVCRRVTLTLDEAEGYTLQLSRKVVLEPFGEAALSEDVVRTGYGAECPEGMAVSRVSPLVATLSDGRRAIAGAVLGCAALSVDGDERVVVGPELVTAAVRGDFVTGVEPEAGLGACPAPVAVGLHGRTGAWVDAVGAVCAELTLDHTAP